MIPFFRRISKKLADDNRPLKNMRYVIGEVVLVAIAIFIALNLNNWNENRKINRGEIEIISLKGDSSYFEICHLVGKKTFDDIKCFVKIKDGENIKTIPLFSYGGGHKRETDQIRLTKDSVYSIGLLKMPRKDLKIALKKFYLDKGHDGYVVIELWMGHTGKDLESLLLNLTQEFDKMNSETEQSYDLRFYLLCITPVKPPPPPE